MRILLSSYVFYPSLGGIESFSKLMAERLTDQGHEVTIITETPHDQADEFPCEVLRCPSHFQKFKAMLWCDVFFQSNITLTNIWPLLFIRRPWIVTHQTWISNIDGRIRKRDILKRTLLKAAQSVSISRAIAKCIESQSVIIPNSYDDTVFSQPSLPAKREGVAFVGRLVSDKGVDLLIEACGAVGRKGIDLGPISIIGTGPEAENLKRQAKDLGLSDQIRFLGKRTGESLSGELHKHKILVVPSRWNEPFGIVALEGLASGCVVIGSNGGGLIDAIGPCGPTFENNDSSGLQEALISVTLDSRTFESHRAAIPRHLNKFKPDHVFGKYLAGYLLRGKQRSQNSTAVHRSGPGDISRQHLAGGD